MNDTPNETETLIIVREGETTLGSIAADAVTLALGWAFIIPGLWFDSWVAQTLGLFIFITAAWSYLAGDVQKSRCTIAEARARLKELEREGGFK